MPKKLSLDLMRRLAGERGGACLSPSYVDAHSKLTWQCARGHRWRAIPNAVRQGHWCKQCADDRRRMPLERLRALAAKRNGVLLAESYMNSQTHVRWRCAHGHEWRAIANSIRRGTWCPACAHGA